MFGSLYEFKCDNGHELLFRYKEDHVPVSISCPIKNCNSPNIATIRNEKFGEHSMARLIGKVEEI